MAKYSDCYIYGFVIDIAVCNFQSRTKMGRGFFPSGHEKLAYTIKIDQLYA